MDDHPQQFLLVVLPVLGSPSGRLVMGRGR